MHWFFQLLIPLAQASGLPAGIGDAGCNFPFGGPGGTATAAPTPGGMWNCIPAYISNITFIVIALSGSLALLLIIANGVRYMIGPVTEGSSDAAKKGITYALVGLAVALLSYVIMDTIIISVTS